MPEHEGPRKFAWLRPMMHVSTITGRLVTGNLRYLLSGQEASCGILIKMIALSGSPGVNKEASRQSAQVRSRSGPEPKPYRGLAVAAALPRSKHVGGAAEC